MFDFVCPLRYFAGDRANSQRNHFEIYLSDALQIQFNEFFSQFYFGALNELLTYVGHRYLFFVKSEHEKNLFIVVSRVVVRLKPNFLIVAHRLNLR